MNLGDCEEEGRKMPSPLLSMVNFAVVLGRGHRGL